MLVIMGDNRLNILWWNLEGKNTQTLMQDNKDVSKALTEFRVIFKQEPKDLVENKNNSHNV